MISRIFKYDLVIGGQDFSHIADYLVISGQDFSHIADYLVNAAYGVADPFMCLADFDSYNYTYRCAMKNYFQI